MSITLASEHDQAIRAHAARDYPNECCGFLVGKTPSEIETVVVKTVEAKNTRVDEATRRFEIDPGELVRVDKAARAEGLGVVGFYHSHPDAPARPSEYDREHAWPGYCYIIVAVENGTPNLMTNWRLRDDRSGFDEDSIMRNDAVPQP